MIRLALCLCLLTLPASAAPRPGFAPEIGTRLDTTIQLRDSTGTAMTLAQALDGRPAVLLPGYHLCPNLCGVIQNQVATSLTEVDLPASDYRVLFVSISPAETPQDAADARARLHATLPEADLAPWRFLTGPGDRLAQSLGMETVARARSDELVHPVAVLILSGEGRLTRALPPASFRPEDLRLALIEASKGRLGGLAERIYLLCAGFDETQGQYTPVVMGLVRAGGMATLLLLALTLATLAWRRR